MKAKKMMTSSQQRIEEGLAELSGVALCAMPECYRQLRPGQGKQTPIGRVCFGHPAGVAS